MKKANSNFKNLLWTLVSFLTLGFILIAILAIGWQFANDEGTIIESSKSNFTDLIDVKRNIGLTKDGQDVYGLIVSSLFFTSLACAASLTVLILGLFTKETKFVIPGKIVDITLSVLVALSVILVIAGTALAFDVTVSHAKHSLLPLKAAAGPTSGMYILLIAPLAFMALPLTSGNWKKSNK